MTENPFRSPSVDQSLAEPIRYPKRVLAAQLCGVLISVLFFIESYVFPRRDVPWPYIVFWIGVVTLVATLLMTIRSRISAVIVLVYFEVVACISILGWLVAFYNSQQGPPLFFAIDAGLSITIVAILMQKSTQAYFRNDLST